MGMQLSEAFRRAGLPLPQLGLDAIAGAGEQWEGYDLFAETQRRLMPIIVQFGIAKAALMLRLHSIIDIVGNHQLENMKEDQ
jgi:hypothetical protein